MGLSSVQRLCDGIQVLVSFRSPPTRPPSLALLYFVLYCHLLVLPVTIRCPSGCPCFCFVRHTSCSSGFRLASRVGVSRVRGHCVVLFKLSVPRFSA